jgi:beta-1,4-mannosyl-glycoprotein beta-1,4-N-acetylglucosaminyltransferase
MDTFRCDRISRSGDSYAERLPAGPTRDERAPVAALHRWWDRGSLGNAGWHCSRCFATVDGIRIKMHSFSHQGWDSPENHEVRTLGDRVRQGLDLFGRPDQVCDRIESNKDVPSYVSEQFERKGRFGYLLDRDGQDAGFEDVESVDEHDV